MEEARKSMHIRPMAPDDLPFVCEMLYEAVYWRLDALRPPMDEALTHPDLAKLLAGWGRPGDNGVIAEDGQGVSAGAAWYRLWTSDNHSYGFVDADTPELGIAVRLEMRGQGLGRRLLKALLAHARAQGVERISLSVELDNPARGLYMECGFETLSTEGGAATMVHRLG